jgi:[ribosomal protein S5]-alanine N-acetyltransferase
MPDAATLTIQTARMVLSLPRPAQAASALAFHTGEWQHLKPWFPPVPPGFDTLTHWQDFIDKVQQQFIEGSSIRLWMSPVGETDHVIGSIGFSQIFRGPFCNCVLGYQIARQYQGQGLMQEALQAAIRYMFVTQRLHRINANYRPENARSGRLLNRLGFRIDGYAKNYLYIDGDWRDHVLTSLINDDFRNEWLK